MEQFQETVSVCPEATFVDANTLSSSLWSLYEDFNAAVNSARYEEAKSLAAEIDLHLAEKLDLSISVPVISLINGLHQIDCDAVFGGRVQAVNFLSGLLYGLALIQLVDSKDYLVSQSQFAASLEMLEVASAFTELNLELRQRLARSAYHEGLAAHLEGNHKKALATFQKLAERPAFRSELELLEKKTTSNRDFADYQDYADTQDVPSDVVSGILYYSALCLMNEEKFADALTSLRKVAVLQGNPITQGLQGLAETKVAECYKGLIKQKCFYGRSNWSVTNRVDVFFYSKRSFVPGANKKSTLSITAVIPVYNGAKLICPTLLSVRDQTLPPNELIIVDDGSEDDSFKVISQLIAQHHFPFDIVMIRTSNGGQSQARNIGAVAATSKLLAYLDQDDLWYPEHLRILRKPFKQNAKLGWTYSDLDEIDLTGKIVHRQFLNIVAPNRRFTSVRDLVHTDMFILPSASLIDREALLHIGGFDEDLSGYEDDDLFIRLFREGFEHVFVDNSLSQWRIHQGSCSYNMRMIISRRKFQRKLTKMFPDDPAMGRFWVRDTISPRFFANGSNRYNVGLATRNNAMCAEALIDMELSMETMVVPLRTRLRVFLCRFPVLYRRLKTVQIHSRVK